MTPRSYWEQSNANPARRRAILEAAIPPDQDGCWDWPGTRTAGGYGQMRGGSKVKIYVHRASYEAFVGPIPDGLHIDHLCRNRACFNPAHLEPVTNAVNCARGMSPGAVVARTNICARGHELTEDNVIRRSDGARQCRPCNVEWQRARYWRNKSKSETAGTADSGAA